MQETKKGNVTKSWCNQHDPERGRTAPGPLKLPIADVAPSVRFGMWLPSLGVLNGEGAARYIGSCLRMHGGLYVLRSLSWWYSGWRYTFALFQILNLFAEDNAPRKSLS